MTDELVRALADLTTVVRDSNERLARLEATIDAQNQNVRTFWSTHWPAVTRRLDALEEGQRQTVDEVSEIKVRVAKLSSDSKHQARSKAKTAALVAGGGTAVAGIVEIIKGLLGPKS